MRFVYMLSHFLVSSCLFFYIIRRPTKSTLFPYTTSSDLGDRLLRLGVHHFQLHDDPLLRRRRLRAGRAGREGEKCERSEEHTSELQSRLHLVCSLLLAK